MDNIYLFAKIKSVSFTICKEGNVLRTARVTVTSERNVSLGLN